MRYFVFLLISIGSFSMISCRTQKKVVSNDQSRLSADTSDVKLSNEATKEFEYLFIEGVKQRTFEKYDEAIKLFSRCLEINPSSSATLYEMANIHIARGDFQSAMYLLEKAVSFNPDNKYYHLLLVKVYQQNKLYEKAADQYELLSQLDPENSDYNLYQGALLTMGGKTEKALALYNRLEKKMGVMEPISLGKQQIYLQQGNKVAAYNEIEKLIATFPSESKYYGLLAELYLADKKRDKALECYNKILVMNPEDGFVHLSIASFYIDGKEPGKAYDHIKLAFYNSELDLETKVQMYMLLIQPGKNLISDTQQLELLHILRDSHIDDERPIALTVDYFMSKKMADKARNELRLVLDMKKDNFVYWQQLLLINNELLDWSSMISDSKMALNYFPDQPLVYILQSVALLQQKKYDEIICVVDSGVVHSQNDPKMLSQLYTYKAEAYYNLKKYKEAFDLFDKVVALDPENFMAMNNYSYYLSLKGERLDVAEKLSAKVVQANPENATYLDTYAWVFFKKKDYQLAKFYMETALSKSSTEDSSVLVEHYGDILFFLNDTENALIQWNKSIQLGNTSEILKQKVIQKSYIETKEN